MAFHSAQPEGDYIEVDIYEVSELMSLPQLNQAEEDLPHVEKRRRDEFQTTHRDASLD